MYAVCVAVPLVLLVGVGLVIYLCCARKYRFNWFENSLLQDSSGELRSFSFYDEKSYFNTQFTPNFYAYNPRESLISGTLLPPSSNCGLSGSVAPIITCVYQKKGGTPYQALSPQPDWDYRRGSKQLPARLSGDFPVLTTASNVRYVSLRARSEESMGSNPSNPTSEENSFGSRSSNGGQHQGALLQQGRTHSQQSASTPLADTPSTPHHFVFNAGAVSSSGYRRGSSGAIIGGEAEQFWVPPTVLHKKRAQSLIPHVLDHGGKDALYGPPWMYVVDAMNRACMWPDPCD